MVKVSIKSFGCSFNQADGLYMKELLKQSGFEITPIQDADVVILNSCTVKQISENKLFRHIKQLNHKKLIITGCVPQAEPEYVNTKLRDYSILGTGAIEHIVKAVNYCLEGKRFVDLSISRPHRLGFSLKKNKVIDILPISQGCTGNCAFCKTKQARFNVVSYPLSIIKSHVIKALGEGVREFWLTSQDLGAYGLDINTNIVNLLYELINIDNIFLMRLGMMNPNHALRYATELSKLLDTNKIFRFFHIPVQSGSESVVRSMNRPHTVSDFINTIKIIKNHAKNKDITLATDIIVGYPTETEHDFEETINLLKKIKPDVVNVSRFWPRPNTKAAKLKQLPTHVVKERSKHLSSICKQIALKKNRKFLNKKILVFIDEIPTSPKQISKQISNHISSHGLKPDFGLDLKLKGLKARTLSYKQVVIQDLPGMNNIKNKISNKLLKPMRSTKQAKYFEQYLGLFSIVKVKEVTHMDLRGEALDIFNIDDTNQIRELSKNVCL